MPRPSLKDERREQILAAFEACVARYGVEGATLEKIAEASGLARPLIRHNVGNRDVLIDALTDRFLARSAAKTQALIEALPKTRPLETLVDWLFDPELADTQLVLLAEALIAAAPDHPALAGQMRQWTADFIKAIEQVVARTNPQAGKSAVAAVATGLTAIYFNHDSFTPLGTIPGFTKASKEAALRLIQTLSTGA